MRRVIRGLPGRQVTLRISAICRPDRQTVVVVDMAGGAAWHLAAVGHQCVRICQREAKCSVVKLAVGPLCDRVAGRTGRSRRRETRSDVVRHTSAERRRAIPRGHMAAHAIGVRCGEGVIVALVTIGAGHDFPRWRQLMGTGQCPASRAVIEDRRAPCDRVVAGRAVRRRKGHACVGVHRIICLLPGRQVAS